MAIQMIAPRDAWQLVSGNDTLKIIDVRTPAEFAGVHISGARLMPLDGFDPTAANALRQNPSDSIFVICHSGGRASKACQLLQDAGITQALCIEGGISAWMHAGLPVERGTHKVISMERQVRIGAGLLVLLGSILAIALSKGFLIIPIAVGAGLAFAGVTDFCGMAIVLGKMPWNQSALEITACKT